MDRETLILGAGPAGLAAAVALHRAGRPVLVAERAPFVGGLTRTEQRGGFRFDLGGHRFYSKNRAVHDFVAELLGTDFREVPRLSRIHFRGRYVDYPIRPFNALRHVGPATCLRILRDLLALPFHQRQPARSLADWMVAAYGPTLFRTYFQVYAEKVWGLPADRIDAGLAAQRVKGLGLWDTVRNALLPRSARAQESMVERFHYPRLGYGQICERMAAVLAPARAVALRTEPVRIVHDGHRVRCVDLRHVAQVGEYGTRRVAPEHVVSSIPITTLLALLDPPPPLPVQRAAAALGFRAVVFVALFLDQPTVRPESWIYFPSPAISFGRITEPRNWSPDLAPAGQTSLVAEHFCDAGDDTWQRSDAALVERTVHDLSDSLRLVERRRVLGSAVVRAACAYPRMDVDHRRHLLTIEQWLARLANLATVGRAGLYRYHNTDHVIETGLLAAANVLGASADVRAVNSEASYHEVRSRS